MRNKILCRQI